MHRNIHRTGQMLPLPKIFYQSKRLSSPMSHQVDAGIHGQESAIPKQCQGLPAKQGKLGRCGSEWERPTRMFGHIENIKNISACSFTLPQATSSQRVFSTTAAHILCKQSAVSLWCLLGQSAILLFPSAWAGQPLWSSHKTISLNLHKKKRKTWLH